MNVLQIEPRTMYRKYKESTHVSDRPSDQSTHLGHLSHLDSHYHRKKKNKKQKTKNKNKKNYKSIQCRLYMKTVVMVVPYRKFVSLMMAYILIVL
jgi:hypothetical protein